MIDFVRWCRRQTATRGPELPKTNGATGDPSCLQSLPTTEDNISLGTGAIDRDPVYGDPISGPRKRRRSYSHSHGDKDRERPVEAPHSILGNSKKRRPNSSSSRIKDSERWGDERPSSSVSDSNVEKSDDPSSGIRPASVSLMNLSEGTASAEEKLVSKYEDTLKGNEKEWYLRLQRLMNTIRENSKERRPNSSSSRIKDSERRGDERPSSSVSDSSIEKSDDPSSGVRPASVSLMNSSKRTASTEEKLILKNKDTLKGNEKELYLRVERCVDTKMYQDGAWETNVTSIWEEEAAKLQAEKEGVVAKLASPSITANMTEVRKAPLKKQVISLERRQERARQSLMRVCKTHIREWYKLDGLSPDELAKRVNYLLDEERFQSPEDHYDDSKGHPSFRFHAPQLRKLTVERFFAKPQGSGRKNPTLAKIYAYGKAPCIYAATVHQCLTAWRDGSFDKSIKNTKAVMNKILQKQLATWNNLSDNYRDNVCRGLKQSMLEAVPENDRWETLVQPRREPTDCANLDRAQHTY
ncbi:hypothetical protein HO173_003252 [Letharia columbiana]|uniref:DUF6532 domain-containing protein n=1 Tax=Letharia columbiana TaxID=112416 RepID=A0A8H6G1G2_9LECA|nr:uncharacterized protein HO173_003252 [Letharia columbiana]KAF6238746.1 hypothetical protein HO173_003252 [Letharia columbiana]